MIKASSESMFPFRSMSAALSHDSDWMKSAKNWRISKGSIESTMPSQLTSPRSADGATVRVAVAVGVAMEVAVGGGGVVGCSVGVGLGVATGVAG